MTRMLNPSKDSEEYSSVIAWNLIIGDNSDIQKNKLLLLI